MLQVLLRWLWHYFETVEESDLVLERCYFISGHQPALASPFLVMLIVRGVVLSRSTRVIYVPVYFECWLQFRLQMVVLIEYLINLATKSKCVYLLLYILHCINMGVNDKIAV